MIVACISAAKFHGCDDGRDWEFKTLYLGLRNQNHCVHFVKRNDYFPEDATYSLVTVTVTLLNSQIESKRLDDWRIWNLSRTIICTICIITNTGAILYQIASNPTSETLCVFLLISWSMAFSIGE